MVMKTSPPQAGIGQRKKRLGPENPGKIGHRLGIGVGHAHLITSSRGQCSKQPSKCVDALRGVQLA